MTDETPPEPSMNTTDYDFPDEWGLMEPEQKSKWMLVRRVNRQAARQKEARNE